MRQYISLLFKNRKQGKYVILIYTLLIFFPHTGFYSSVKGAEEKSYNIGVSSGAFGSVNNNDASAALKAWSTMIEKEQKLKVRFQTHLLTGSSAELQKFFISGEFDGIALSTKELLESNLSPEYVYAGKREKGFSVNYLIVSHSQGGVASPEDLVDCNIVTFDNNQMITSLQWLEMILFKHANGKKKIPPVIVDSPSKAILKVFFRQSDAALITKEAFILACELNPQLKKDIRVICESPPLIPFIFILRPSAKADPDRMLLEKIILDIGNSKAGRQILMIIQSSNLVKKPVSILDTTYKFLNEHDHLIKEPLFRRATP